MFVRKQTWCKGCDPASWLFVILCYCKRDQCRPILGSSTSIYCSNAVWQCGPKECRERIIRLQKRRGFSMEMAIALLPLHQDDRLCTREQRMLPVRGRCRARIVMSDGRNCGHPIAFSRLAILANATPSVALRWEDRIRTDFSGRGFFFPSYVYRLKAMTKSNTTLHLWPTPTFADQHNLILSGIAA